MVFKLAGGLYFILAGISALGVVGVSGPILGVVALVAGIALIAGQ